MPGAKVFACRDAIGGELDDTILRKKCIEGDSKFRAALMAAGHLGSQPTAPVEASFPPPSQPEGEPSPESSLVSQLQERIDELESLLKVGGEGQFKAQKICVAIAKKHGLRFADIRGNSRVRHVVVARHEAVRAVLASCPNLSLPAVGRVFNLDHSTIIYIRDGCRGRGPLSQRASA
jgi:hypothetical protein